jgi:hypothetical protein
MKRNVPSWGMLPHVHEALAQVRAMHQVMIEKQRFKGYSGRARAVCGCLALLAALGLARIPDARPRFVVLTWLGLAAVSIAINFGAVVGWFLRSPAADRHALRLKPLIELFPALLVGAALTLAFVRAGAYGWLPPLWMLVFGLANLGSRHVLATGVTWVGWFYIACGSALLLAEPGRALGNPWPMGLTFFVGEWLGGLVLHFDEPERGGWAGFWGAPVRGGSPAHGR